MPRLLGQRAARPTAQERRGASSSQSAMTENTPVKAASRMASSVVGFMTDRRDDRTFLYNNPRACGRVRPKAGESEKSHSFPRARQDAAGARTIGLSGR